MGFLFSISCDGKRGRALSEYSLLISWRMSNGWVMIFPTFAFQNQPQWRQMWARFRRLCHILGNRNLLGEIVFQVLVFNLLPKLAIILWCSCKQAYQIKIWKNKKNLLFVSWQWDQSNNLKHASTCLITADIKVQILWELYEH